MTKTRKSKPSKAGACRLCLQQRQLCYSHIISEFMYAPLYDDHRFKAVDASGSGSVETEQKGYREYLLCRACEGHFGEWERQVAPIFVTLRQKLRNAPTSSLISLPAKYTPLKLFMLSILWRASVAQHPNFAAIDLGSSEPTVRSMLLNSNPGGEATFPVTATAYANINYVEGIISPAGSNTLAGIPVAWLDISGVRWLYWLSPGLTSLAALPPLAVTRNELRVLVSTLDETIFLKKLAPLVR